MYNLNRFTRVAFGDDDVEPPPPPPHLHYAPRPSQPPATWTLSSRKPSEREDRGLPDECSSPELPDSPDSPYASEGTADGDDDDDIVSSSEGEPCIHRVRGAIGGFLRGAQVALSALEGREVEQRRVKLAVPVVVGGKRRWDQMAEGQLEGLGLSV